MERRLCGVPTVDIEALRRHTTYGGGLTGEEPEIGYFWSVLRGFSQDQRRLFIRFTWAQERLPTSDDAWGGTRFLIKHKPVSRMQSSKRVSGVHTPH